MKNAAICSNWASLPVIATVARLLCRELTLQNEYLRAENKLLKSKIKGRIRFTDDERRSLADAALAMGRRLMEEVVGIVKPETIPAWQRRFHPRLRQDSGDGRRGCSTCLYGLEEFLRLPAKGAPATTLLIPLTIRIT